VKRIRSNFSESLVKKSFQTLDPRDRLKLVVITILQIFSGLLDLAGIALIGALGALSVSGVQSRPPGDRVTKFLDFFNLETFSFQSQVAILGLSAALLLISKTIFSVFFTRRTLFFLSRRSAAITSRLVAKVLNQPLLWIQQRTHQQTLFAITDGVSAITVGVIGNAVGLISDMSLVLLMMIGLFAVDPSMALGTLLTFSSIGVVLYLLLHKRAQHLGMTSSKLAVSSNESIIEVLTLYRELVVRNRREFYSRKISEIRFKYADTLAEAAFMPNISKYVIETTVVLGALGLSAVQFQSKSATQAVATLSVFMAAGLRIAPAVLRVQQAALSFRGASGIATPTIEMIDFLKDKTEIGKSDDSVKFDHEGFNASISLKNVCLTYPGRDLKALNSINLDVNPGEFIAIVGPSGAGKTSLVDVLLGVLKQDSGQVTIGGVTPGEAVKKWPGAISYVPQDVVIVNGTVKQNVALGYPDSSVSDEQVISALNIAHLEHFLEDQPQGMHSEVGEFGTKISGGQRQRLGIARAVFTSPKLLVLDEATSALDGETENNISDSIQALKGQVTVVMIAHRLSTVREADKVVYMENGKVISSGKFEDVRREVANFDHQAKLMGL
jgi:ABC-type multidrug transport system fused ATPase/permease subunit